MTLWVVLALMTGAAVMSVLWPLSRRASAATQADPDIRFYRDQMGEIARDGERGLLDEREIEAVRAEAGRRLLRAGSAAHAIAVSTGEPALRRRRAASAIGLSVVPIVALTVYGALGSPGLRPPQPVSPIVDASKLDFNAALARVEAHLAANPQDGRGWDLIAPIYLRNQRFEEAERAFAAAIRIGGATPDRLAGRGEALFGAAAGVVTAEARAVFDRALALDPASAKAHFYLGIAAEQDGDPPSALRHYDSIVATSAADAPWLPVVRDRLASLRGDTTAATSSGSIAASPEIRAMVEGLDARLAAQGGTVEEWERLMRSYVVLGERDKAIASLGRARLALAGQSEQAEKVTDAARALGLDIGRASR